VICFRWVFGLGVKKMNGENPERKGIKEMSVNGSVVSNDSVDVKAMMEVLDAPVAPITKGKRVQLKTKATKKTAEVVAPVVETVVETVVEPVEEPVVEPVVESETAEVEEINYKELYRALRIKYDELVAKTTKPKNDNSPDLAEGIHIRMVGGVKTKTKYIFPYQADGGKSIVKDMKDGDKCIGVSTTQPNNSKGKCKVADYDLIWVNKGIVKDTKTGKVYTHKDGKFAILDETTMTSFNVRMMVVAE
jgi:hypothetical protein